MIKFYLTFRRPKQHWPLAPDVQDGTNGQAVVKSLKTANLFKMFSQVLKTPNKYLSTPKSIFNPEKNSK